MFYVYIHFDAVDVKISKIQFLQWNCIECVASFEGYATTTDDVFILETVAFYFGTWDIELNIEMIEQYQFHVFMSKLNYYFNIDGVDVFVRNSASLFSSNTGIRLWNVGLKLRYY